VVIVVPVEEEATQAVEVVAMVLVVVLVFQEQVLIDLNKYCRTFI
jgi:hypothetical protein